MHLPDGFLTANTWIPAWIISAGGIGLFIKKVSRLLQEKMLPLMGLMSAFVFAAQMVNFPVLGGTSGHLLGAVLSAVLLGPYAASIVLTCVLIVQCLIFQDGGLTALGANILNMAIIGSFSGYYIYKIISKLISGNKGILIAVAVASWISIVSSAIACSLELAISGTSPIKIVLPAMLIIHALIGIGEAVITTLVISFIIKVRPDLIYSKWSG